MRKLTHTFGDTVLWQDALSKYGYIELPLKVIPHTNSSCVVSLSCKQRQILVKRVLPKATIGGLPTSPTYTFLTTLCSTDHTCWQFVVYMQSSLFMHGPYLKQTLHALPLCILLCSMTHSQDCLPLVTLYMTVVVRLIDLSEVACMHQQESPYRLPVHTALCATNQRYFSRNIHRKHDQCFSWPLLGE